MHLVVFDVDGTLANTAPVDMECFWQAAKEIFRLPSDYPTWVEGLKDVTVSQSSHSSAKRLWLEKSAHQN